MSLDPLINSNRKMFDGISLTSTQVSAVTDISDTPLYSVHAVFSGSPVGVFTVEGSNVLDPTQAVVIASYAVPVSNSRILLNVEKAGYAFMYLRYTFTSGSGTLTATVCTKGI